MSGVTDLIVYSGIPWALSLAAYIVAACVWCARVERRDTHQKK